MKKLMCVVLLCVASVSCKGPSGEKGDPGQAGLPGPGNGGFVFLNGAVTSDDFTITDSRINQANQIGVYVGDGSVATQLPFFMPALGMNCIYMLKNGQIEIFNAQKAGATKFVVEIIVS
jgi:hypothetical protein